jgi:hypothetical protein
MHRLLPPLPGLVAEGKRPMSLAFRCEIDGEDPHWRITRIGDVATSWACDSHLAIVCDRLQRDFEVTELAVWDCRKMREWAGIRDSLEQIAEGTP